MSGGITLYSIDASTSSSSAITSKTTTYLATLSDDVIYVDDSGGSWTLSFPSAASSTGHVWTVIKTNSSTNQVTLDPNASETINGYSTMKVFTQYECYRIQSNGTNLFVFDHRTETPWAVDAGFTPNASAFGTVTLKEIRKKRVGDNMYIRGSFTAGTVAAAEAYVSMPTGYSIDTTKIIGSSINDLGLWTRLTGSSSDINAATQQGTIFSDGVTTDRVWISASSQSSVFQKNNASSIISTGQLITVVFSVPILNWYE